jgi:putative chitinase
MLERLNNCFKGLLNHSVGIGGLNKIEDVKTVQFLLNDHVLFSFKANLTVDGKFGKKTDFVLRAFQRSVKLSETGLITPNCKTFMMLTKEIPQYFCPFSLNLIFINAKKEDCFYFSGELLKVFDRYKINNFLRQSHFLAQIGHESAELRYCEEIATGRAYEFRKDLGNFEAGDGVKYKGRGLIQLTGKYNYSAYQKHLKLKNDPRDIIENPQIISRDTDLSVDVAGWFWEKNNLNEFADKDDLKSITQKINGGLNGFQDRKRLMKRAFSVLKN